MTRSKSVPPCAKKCHAVGWEQNDWFPYSKYFYKELRNPGIDDDILFCEEKKATLRWRLDAALEEMKNLIAKIK